MNQADLISLYGNLTYVCLGVAVVGFIFSVFFFFFFDIRSVFATMFGKSQESPGKGKKGKKAKKKKRRKNVTATQARAPQGASAPPVERTTVLSQEPSTLPLYQPMQSEGSDVTAQLRTPPVRPVNFRFYVTEDTFSIHTDEII